MVKLRSSFVIGWAIVLGALGMTAMGAATLPSVRILGGWYTSAPRAVPADTVTYADKRIVYTVDVDTATNASGQLRYILDLSQAPTGALMLYLMKPDFDSAMIVTGDTFNLAHTDSATALARSISWGVIDPYTVALAWHGAPDPVTGMTLVFAEDTFIADWGENVDDYQVTGGLNAGPGADFTDTVTTGPHKRVMTIAGVYWGCVQAFNGIGISETRCLQATYTDTIPPSDTHEPPGMTEMFANNDNFAGDVAGPNNFSFLDSINHDPFGMRATPASLRPTAKLSIGDPTALGIGAPLPPSGSDSVLIGLWPDGFGSGSGPFSVGYSRSWSGNPARKSMYWSMQMFIDTAFEMHPNTTKGFWMSQDQNNNHFVAFAINGSSGFGIYLQFNDGPPDGEVSPNVNYGGIPPNQIPRGSWFNVEFLFVANSANAVHDGKYRVWIDGVEKVSHDTVYYFDTADSNKAFSTARWNPTWGGGCDCAVQQDQYILIDDWYISYADSLVTP